MRFVDTNILLYSISLAPAEQSKQAIALRILAGGNVALSTQVLQEFYVQATRASGLNPAPHELAVRLVESFARFPVQATTLSLVRAAMASRERFRISYWDAAIVEAARASGCTVILSEDLSHGQSYDGVLVENPFL